MVLTESDEQRAHGCVQTTRSITVNVEHQNRWPNETAESQYDEL